MVNHTRPRVHVKTPPIFLLFSQFPKNRPARSVKQRIKLVWPKYVHQGLCLLGGGVLEVWSIFGLWFDRQMKGVSEKMIEKAEEWLAGQ